MRTEAVRIVSKIPSQDWKSIEDPLARAHFVVALQRSGLESARTHIPSLLQDPAEEVCFVAVKWIAEEKLAEFRTELFEQTHRSNLTQPLLFAILATEQILDGTKLSDRPTPEQLSNIFSDRSRDPQIRALALSMSPPDSFSTERLAQLASIGPHVLQLEALRNLQASQSPDRVGVLTTLALDLEQPSQVRAEAVLGLAHIAEDHGPLTDLSSDSDPAVASEAQRALVAAGLQARTCRSKLLRRRRVGRHARFPARKAGHRNRPPSVPPPPCHLR